MIFKKKNFLNKKIRWLPQHSQHDSAVSSQQPLKVYSLTHTQRERDLSRDRSAALSTQKQPTRPQPPSALSPFGII